MINVSKNPGSSAWNDLLPERETLPSLSGNLKSDWLIVGAGFAGLSAARRVQQEAPNDSIVILDAQELASGPAGRNSGFMIDLPCLLYTSPSPRDPKTSRMPSSA